MARYKITETLPVWVEYVSYVEAESEEEATQKYYDGDLQWQDVEIGENVDDMDSSGITVERETTHAIARPSTREDR